MTQKKPVLLCILDGWGISDVAENNPLELANLPNWQRLWNNSPRTLLNASEQFVGLPSGQMGNSEVGHMNIGSGRPVRQLLPRINEAIESGIFSQNIALQHFIADLQATNGACHLLGVASDGGVHGHINHIIELMRIMNEAGVATWLHAFTDGRDVAPKSAHESGFIAKLKASCDDLEHVQFATIGGRYYAMDRDNNWERVEHAYNAIVGGVGFEARNALDALQKAYARGENDEFIKPTVIDGYEGMTSPNDGVLMSNYRPDRARQIMQVFTIADFDGFSRNNFGNDIIASENCSTMISPPLIKNILGVADYWSEDCPLTIPAMFPLEKLEHTLGELIAKSGLKQLRIAETEKFNHVTYFLSGANGIFIGEDRILIPSPKVATYDMQPEMSAFEVTSSLVAAITSGGYDFIAVNYANPDMVGHTGDLAAAIKAVEVVDECLGALCTAIDAAGGVMLVTADHGNVEIMQDAKGNPHTQHTVNLVPFVLYGDVVYGDVLLDDDCSLLAVGERVNAQHEPWGVNESLKANNDINPSLNPSPQPSPARGEGVKEFSPARGEGVKEFSPARGEGAKNCSTLAGERVSRGETEGRPWGVKLRNGGALCDIAPTILRLMNIAQPAEMTGESLIN